MSSTRIVGWDLPKTSLGVPKFDMSNVADIGSGALKARSDITLPATEQFIRCQSNGALMTQKFSSKRGVLLQSGSTITTWTQGTLTDNIDLDALGVNNMYLYIYATGLVVGDLSPIDAFGVADGNYYLLEVVQKTQSGPAFLWKIDLKHVPFRYVALSNAGSKPLTVDVAVYLGY